ncbi:class D beta-lactamase [Laspinema olomoucense]|uniref:class D beta-lactamase n=1 Tax=Laspinema olomoucense TaxID=3231600 RepID=UPI0021BB6DB3|nr:class D beta-lactamase [Laspinema sp. D3c]MCT7995664.1 class D beta-lactamase [Laspinema sp. D3c]
MVSMISLIFTIFPNIKPASTLGQSGDKAPVSQEIAQNFNFGQHFQELGVEGSIIIGELNSDRLWQHNPKRNQTPFPTASTFKILNSLIALETGVIPHELAVLTWDGIPRTIPTWNRDLNLKEAFKLSAVWFYQVLARRIGYERMQQWITQVGYGNQNIGKPEDIDQFWLQGNLQITPQEQVQFLRRLYNNDLPFSEQTLTLVKEIMIYEQTPDYTIRAKTGWFGFGNESLQNIGWFVGYVETPNNAYFFATNIDVNKAEDGPARIELTRRCLRDIGVL